MKLQLNVSVSQYLTGGCVSKPISITLLSLLSHKQAYSHRFRFQGFKGLQRWVHSSFSSNDDFLELGSSFSSNDDFLELGPPVIQGVNTQLKLATEKREFFMKSKDASRNSTASKPVNMNSIPTAKNLLTSLERFAHTHPKDEKPKNISKTAGNSKCHSNVKNSKSISISIENVPLEVYLSKLVEAASSFGKISGAYMKSLTNGLACCIVSFETEESSWSAVSAGKITIGNLHLPIRPLYVPNSITIRIKNIGKDTAYTAVHSICKTIGELAGMAKATENSIDVLFSINEFSDSQNILAELNNKIVDDCQWSAHLLPKSSSPTLMSKNEVPGSGLQVRNLLSELKNECSMRKMYAEDLEYMHLAIMHLEEQQTVDCGPEIN